MSREFKNLPYFAIKAEAGSRIRKGIAAVFGNVDSFGDRIQKGAFKKTITEGKSRAKHLWNHDFSQPPIAAILELKEIEREDLPAEVLAYAPEATGGLLVVREYLDTERGNEVLAGLDAGAITEMSFGFDVMAEELKEETIDGEKKSIRELKELRLYDTSDVLWGMNSATVATGAKAFAMPLPLIAQSISAMAQDVKAGRRNAATDLDLINAIHDASIGLGCTSCASAELKHEQDSGDESESAKPEESEPIQAETLSEPETAETATDSISLNTAKLELQKLELEIINY
jgi:HK97 family phage prohead protease